MRRRDHRHVVAKYGHGTGLTNVRDHFSDHHMTEWVTLCDRKQIKIVAKTVQRKLEAYRRSHGQTYVSPHTDILRVEYSWDAMVDLLSLWVVNDDQVIQLLTRRQQVS